MKGVRGNSFPLTFKNMADKYRYFMAVCYPESLPYNWLEILNDTFVSVAVSPLHDRDIHDDGSLKKPHYHFLICYDGPTTFSTVVKHFTAPLNAPNPKIVLSPSGAYAYLTHSNHPNKAQYNPLDIIHLNNCSSSNFSSDSIKSNYFDLIENIILDKSPNCFRSLLCMVKDLNDSECLSILRSNCYYFKSLL